MKIISSWKDYYDNMRCYANPSYCSDDFIYKRKTSTIEIPQKILRFIVDRKNENNNQDINRHIIGFCGQWYFIYSIKTDETFYTNNHEYINYTFFTHIKDVLMYNWNYKYIKKCFKSNNFGYSNIFQDHKQTTLDKTIDKVLNVYVKYEQNLLNEYSTYLNSLDLFKQHNTPVLEIRSFRNWQEAEVVINPNLEKLSFYKMIEGNIAYQELEMYLGNELLPKDDANQITDNLILAANHGFNKKSFRKAPSKADKRAKRKAHKLRKRNTQV